MDQIQDGLQSFGLMTLMRNHPPLARLLLFGREPKPLTADTFLSLFLVQFSPDMSNARAKEEAIYLNWTDFVSDVHKGCTLSQALTLYQFWDLKESRQSALIWIRIGFSLLPHVPWS